MTQNSLCDAAKVTGKTVTSIILLETRTAKHDAHHAGLFKQSDDKDVESNLFLLFGKIHNAYTSTTNSIEDADPVRLACIGAVLKVVLKTFDRKTLKASTALPLREAYKWTQMVEVKTLPKLADLNGEDRETAINFMATVTAIFIAPLLELLHEALGYTGTTHDAMVGFMQREVNDISERMTEIALLAADMNPQFIGKVKACVQACVSNALNESFPDSWKLIKATCELASDVCMNPGSKNWMAVVEQKDRSGWGHDADKVSQAKSGKHAHKKPGKHAHKKPGKPAFGKKGSTGKVPDVVKKTDELSVASIPQDNHLPYLDDKDLQDIGCWKGVDQTGIACKAARVKVGERFREEVILSESVAVTTPSNGARCAAAAVLGSIAWQLEKASAGDVKAKDYYQEMHDKMFGTLDSEIFKERNGRAVDKMTNLDSYSMKNMLEVFWEYNQIKPTQRWMPKKLALGQVNDMRNDDSKLMWHRLELIASKEVYDDLSNYTIIWVHNNGVTMMGRYVGMDHWETVACPEAYQIGFE